MILSLFDDSLEKCEKEDVALALYNTIKPESFPPKKPVFPMLFGPGIPSLSDLVGPESWLLFQQLKIEGDQVWLTIPSQHWVKFKDFRYFLILSLEYLNITVYNVEGYRIMLTRCSVSMMEQNGELLCNI